MKGSGSLSCAGNRDDDRIVNVNVGGNVLELMWATASNNTFVPCQEAEISGLHSAEEISIARFSY
jgi:hypothetical protein